MAEVSATLGAVPGAAQRAGAATAGAKLRLRALPTVPATEIIVVTAGGDTMKMPGCSAQCSPADGTDDPGGGEMAGPRVEQGEAGGGGQQVGLQARGGEE